MPTNHPKTGRSRQQSRFSVRTLIWVVAASILAWLLVPGLGPNLLGLERGQGTQNSVTGENTELLQQLSRLEVVDNQDAPPYVRSEFGEGWADLDGDGCSTRNEILARDLHDVTYRKGTGDCVVQSGILQDPYTGETIRFERGADTSSLVQIDHVVALGNAWYAGAWEWDAAKRLEFANDPLNLLAVDGNANFEKGAHTADQWSPSNKDSHCEFAARQVAVKSRWGLSVTQAESETLTGILETCPQVSLSE